MFEHQKAGRAIGSGLVSECWLHLVGVLVGVGFPLYIYIYIDREREKERTVYRTKTSCTDLYYHTNSYN